MFESKRFENSVDRTGAAGRNALIGGGLGSFFGPLGTVVGASVMGAIGWIRNKPIGYRSNFT